MTSSFSVSPIRKRWTRWVLTLSGCLLSILHLPQQEPAVFKHKEIENPKTIGLLSPATESYIDHSKWKALIPGVSLLIISTIC